MNNEKKYTQVIKKGILKTILWLFIAIISVFVTLAIVLQIPSVQTRAVQYLSKNISEKTGFHVSISHVDLEWFDILILKEVKVLDFKNNLMIGVEELVVDFQIKSLLNAENNNVDLVRLENAQINLIRNTNDQDLNINLFIQRIKDLTSSATKTGRKGSMFSIDEVEIIGTDFSMNNPLKEPVTQGFDYQHFDLENINASFADFKIISDTTQLNVLEFSAFNNKHSLEIKNFRTFFRFSQSAMEFQQLELKANNSIIRDSVVLRYDNLTALNHLIDSVQINANLEGTEIDSKDLAIFAPALQQYDEVFKISGKFNGLVNHFSLKEFQLHFGNNSNFEGELSFDGLPNFKESFIEIKLENSRLDAKDIQQYVSPKAFQNVQKFGTIRFNGQFIGFPSDFVANGEFQTNLGRVVSDINLKLTENPNNATYTGNLATYNFNLGKLTDRPDLFQNISMNGHISGKGFTIENADFNLNANIKALGFKNYDYQNIETDARLSKEFFEGKLNIRDPNLKFTASGSIDLREDKNIINIQAKLDTAFLKPLNLSAETIFLSTNADLNIRGLTLDEIIGVAEFTDSYILYKEKDLTINSMTLMSLKLRDERELHLISDILNLDATGEFAYTQLAKDVQRLVKEYLLIFRNDAEEIKAYYTQKEASTTDRYELAYNVYLKDANPLLNLFMDGLYISKNTNLDGRFNAGYTSIFSLNSQIDTLIYNNSILYDNRIDITTSKISDSTNVLASAYVASSNQKVSNLAKTENFFFEGIWNDDHIDFQTNIQQLGGGNSAEILGELEFLTDRTEIRLTNSSIQAIEKTWEISAENRVIFKDKDIIFKNLKLFNEDQSLALYGAISDSTETPLTLEINKFQLENLNPLLAKEFSGEVNALVEVKDFYSMFMLEGKVNVNAFKINDFVVGDIKGATKWNNELKLLNVNLDVFRTDKKTVAIAGTYNSMEEAENQLALLATFDQTNLNILEPFTETIFSNLAGTASGEFKITGSPAYPILKGDGKLENGRFKINYLNTTYTFDGNIVFEENEIGARNLVLRDENLNITYLNGGVFHDGFKDFVINLEADMNNFNVLNTTMQDNDLYYGIANVSGDLEILGDVSNLYFTANATTNKGTKLFIPVGGNADLQQQDFINFISFSDTLMRSALDETLRNVNLSGLKLNFDIDITPDAYCEIIFDIKSGDIIRGRGVGKVNLEIDTKGDFNMFGDYQIQEGGYNFTLYNIINKEFEIQPGSQINWFGDPYHAVLDITATYDQFASLAPLLNTPQDSTSNSPELRRRYPAKVILELEGDLLAPDISFDIAIEDYPENAVVAGGFTLFDIVNRFMNTISLDDNELKRQVFSLIILRRFSPENSFEVGGTLGNSVSELLSNQLSYWASQFDENLEIDVDLNGLDADAFNTFQLRLSYTFLEGRLRVSRDGGFTDVNNEANVSSIAGEWTVEYLLTPDGKFRAKMYNRNNFNAITSSLRGNTTTTAGFSILHVESFDNLKELFRKNRKSNVPTLPDESPLQPDVLKEEEELIPENKITQKQD